MDLWRWLDDVYEQYKDENPRLMWMMYRLPGFIVDNDHEMVDALMPEALALARQIKHPWLEVYLRHWDMQSRILHRSLIKEALPDAIDLLERAHRDDARDCPQTICVSQDVCVAYGRSDGPGYAEERLQVSQETLSRINPKWPCWRCISCEYADALLDQERYEEALAFIEQQYAEMKKVKSETNQYGFRSQFVEAWIGLGRLEDAYAFNKDAEYESLGDGFLIEKRIDQSRLLSMMGRFEEAAEILPAWKEFENNPSDYINWCEAVYLLAREKQWDGDKSAISYLVKAYHQLFSQGVIRQAVMIAAWASELALAGDTIQLAEAIADDLETMIPLLRKPLGADQTLQRLRADIAAARAALTPWTDDEKARVIRQTVEEGVSVPMALRAAEHWPDEWEFQEVAAQVWQYYHFASRAEQLLTSFLERNSGHAEAISTLANSFFEQRDKSKFLDLFNQYKHTKDHNVFGVLHWFQALWTEEEGDRDAAIAILQTAIERLPDHPNIRARLALWLRREGRLEAALTHLNQLTTKYPPGSLDWERLLVATRLGNKEAILDSAQRLELPDPFDEDAWRELIRLTFSEEGSEATYFAVRTGPVTAEVVQISTPEVVPHYMDRVVFEAQPLNPIDPEEDEDTWSQHIFHYNVDTVLKPGGYRTFTMEGEHPGEEAIASLKERLSAAHFTLQVASIDEYTLRDTVTEQKVPGIYALIAVPGRDSLRLLQQILASFAKQVNSVLIWPQLLEELGDEEELAQHREWAERYGME